MKDSVLSDNYYYYDDFHFDKGALNMKPLRDAPNDLKIPIGGFFKLDTQDREGDKNYVQIWFQVGDCADSALACSVWLYRTVNPGEKFHGGLNLEYIDGESDDEFSYV